MRRNIARAPRIAILEPGAADIVILLVYLYFDVLKGAFRFICKLQACSAGTDDDDPDLASLVEELLGYAVAVEVAAVVPGVLMRGVCRDSDVFGRGGRDGDDAVVTHVGGLEGMFSKGGQHDEVKQE